MILRDMLAKLDRAQRSRAFKIIATVVLAALGVAAMTWYVVERARIDTEYFRVHLDETVGELPADASPALRDAYERAKSTAEATARALNRVVSARADPTSVAVGIAAVTALAVAVVWLGIGLSSLLVLLMLAAVAWPLIRWGEGGWHGAGLFIAAVGALAFAFIVLMELLKLLFSGPWAISAIARNVVLESVRMKVSLVFIVLLLFALAALPGQLDPETPLRYRVQSFLQYGAGGTFWVIALLVLFLSVGTVAFEQRDRVIWQTMTKPVAAWQYLLGKWLGVAGVAAVLLTVSATGVFLFVGYLREQTAIGESRPFVARGGELVAEDRMILETQVLAARHSVAPTLDMPDPDTLNRMIADRIERTRIGDPGYQPTIDDRRRMRDEILVTERDAQLAIEAGNREKYVFYGLGPARARAESLTFRYRVDSGGNDPRALVRITIDVPNMQPAVQEVPLGQTLTFPISPAAIDARTGSLEVTIINGDAFQRVPNADMIAFPPDGLEIFYPVSSYRANFLRVMLVLWMKLAFLAMVGIWAATHLSFAVACLVAFGVFLMAESAGFLTESLEYYASTGDKNEIMWSRVLIRAVAVPVSYAFRFYADLRPTTHLVDGRVLGWGTVVSSIGVLGALTGVLYTMAVAIFRRRELATYSGQ